MNEYLVELLERIESPISIDNPCGENARYDDRYDIAKNEIMKLTAGASVIDWKGIRVAVDNLLSEKTKDLTLAAYLSLALLKEYEYAGLLVGIQIINSFLEKWWEPMFPPVNRLKARVQVFEWMDERLSIMVSTVKPNVEQLRKCKELCDALPEKIRTLAKAHVTGFSRLRSEINQALDKLPAPEPPKIETKSSEEESAVTKNEEPPLSESKQDAERQPIASSHQEIKSQAPTAAAPKIELPPSVENIETVDAGINAIIKIVHLLRGVDPLSPITYRLARVLKWDLLREAPAAAADGKTKIPAPNQQSLTIIETQRNAGNWVGLTQSAEHMFITQGILFIDLQRYVCEGLMNQGAEEASVAVKLETGRLLNRLPVIVNMSYQSGLPFANDETRRWAQEAQAAALGPGASNEEDDGKWLKEAMTVATKSMASALPLLNKAISNAENAKKVMIRQRDVAKFFISNREYGWAMPLLESLNEKIDTMSLAEWDKDFCADVWELMLSGYTAMPSAIETTGKDNLHIVKIRQKLFETNVAKAAALTPKEKKK